MLSEKTRASPRKKRGLRLIALPAIYLAAFSVPFALENASEIGELVPATGRRLTDGAAWYQRVTSAGHRHLLPRYTALLSLDTKTLPASLLVNVCDEQRELLSRLIRKAGQAEPGMIVLDFVFLEESCDSSRTGKGSGTAHLVEAVQNVADKRPLLMGQEVTEENGGLEPKASIPFGTSPNVETGLVVFNTDLRKVPLTWDVANANEPVRTLAFQAAMLYRSTFPDKGDALRELADRGRHPFTGFIAVEEFPDVDAMSILCNKPYRAGKDWRACAEGEGDAAELAKLRGRIVVVGWKTELHHTVLAEMPGFVIHANYIEALLDEHYLKTIGFWWQVLISAGWFLVMEIPFWAFGEGTAKPFSIALLAWVAVAFLVYYVAVVNLGYFTALWVPSLAALLIRASYRFHEDR